MPTRAEQCRPGLDKWTVPTKCRPGPGRAEPNRVGQGSAIGQEWAAMSRGWAGQGRTGPDSDEHGRTGMGTGQGRVEQYRTGLGRAASSRAERGQAGSSRDRQDGQGQKEPDKA